MKNNKIQMAERAKAAANFCGELDMVMNYQCLWMLSCFLA
jgi:deoxyribose-phosphate aldolase